MKICISHLIALYLFASCAVALNPAKDSGRKAEHVERQQQTSQGCNANVCFAIDGSGSISGNEFALQKSFVLDVAAILSVDTVVEYAVVQYGTSATTIVSLTADFSEFAIAVDGALQIGGQSAVFDGIDSCIRELSGKSGEANKIVLLGDGGGNVGPNPVIGADFFRARGGTVCAVGTGFTDTDQLLEIAGGDSDLVFEVDSFLDTLSVTDVIEGLVASICGN